MSMFKRGLAMVLALLVLTMAVPFGGLAVFAVDENYLVEGEDAVNEVFVSMGTYTHKYFVPKESGKYYFYSASDRDTKGWIEDSTGYRIAYDDDSGEGSNFRMEVNLFAGETYTFVSGFYSSYEGSFPVYVVMAAPLDVTGLPQLEVGMTAQADITTAGQEITYVFTPDHDGNYAFYSSASEGDTYGYIFDVYGNELESNDDGGEGVNFRVTYTMTGGVTYLLKAKWLDSDATGSFPVAVEEYFPKTATAVEFHDRTYMASLLEEEYFSVEPQYTVTFSDGTSETYTGTWFMDEARDYSITLEYATPWEEWTADGTYSVTAIVEGLNITQVFLVTFETSPVVSVEVPTVYQIERLDGSEHSGSYYDEETGEYIDDSWWHYSLNTQNAVITLKDGTVVKGSGFEWNGTWYSISYNDPQSYENQWGIGTHTVEATLGGYAFTYEVEVIDSPVASVTVEPISHIYNVDVSYNWYTYYDEETGEYVDVEWNSYNSYPQNVVITLKDGTVIEGTDFDWNGNWYGLDYKNTQSYENQWGIGTHVVEASIAGYEFTYEVEIVPSPVVSVTVKPQQHIVNYHGWETWEWQYDENGEEYQAFYWCYNCNPGDTVITLRDGTVIEGTEFEWEGRSFYISWENPQSYNNQWGIGLHDVEASIAGYEFTYQVEITASPIASIVVEPVQKIEHNSGYWNTYTDWVDGEPVEREWYCYNGLDLTATITMQDGTVYEGVQYVEYDDSTYWLNIDQSYEQQLRLGVNQATGKMLGCPFTVTVEIIETPVASVSVGPVLAIEYANGSWNSGWYWDEEQQVNIYKEYFRYNNVYPWNSDVVITLKDGTVINGSSFTWNGVEYNMSSSGGGPDKYLVKGVNEWTASIAGYEFTYIVEIIDTPVASVVAAPINVVENENGYWNNGSYWDEELQQRVDVEYFHYWNVSPRLTVTMKDGTVHENCTGFYWNDDWFSLSLDIQGPQNPLLPGVNVRTGTIAGCEFTYEISVNTLGTNESFEYMETQDGILITDCFITEDTVEIPAEINGKPVIGVVSLNTVWTTLRHLVLPDTVVTLGDYLLSNLSYLESVHLGASVANLTSQMFAWSNSLATITISDKNPNYSVVNNALHDKGLSTFLAYPMGNESLVYVVPATVIDITVIDEFWCYSQLEVIFPADHVAYVTVDGVTYNKEMTKVISCRKDKTGDYVMPETVEEIADGAFAYTDLVNVVVSPKVTEIVYCAFASCASLESITLPEGLVSIGDYAFYQTGALEGVDLPETLTSIGLRAFNEGGLTALTVPGSVEYVGASAFRKTPLASLTLEEGVQAIDDYAFANTQITSLVLPDSLTELWQYAFNGCRNLTSLTIGSGLTTISRGAFANTGLTSLVVPGTVTVIEAGAFSNAALCKLVLQEGVAEIHADAFYGNVDLAAVHLPASVGYLGNRCFGACESLASLTVAEGNKYFYSDGNCVLTYGGTLLVGCPASEVPTDGSVKMIGDYAFYDLDNLTAVQIPDSVVSIGTSAYQDCEGITSVVIPNSVTSVGIRAFAYTGLNHAELSDNIEFMGYAAFAGSALQSVDLGEGIQTIAPGGFGFTDLTHVFIPSSVTTIMYEAFEYCDALTSVELPITVESIEYRTFNNCESLTDVYYQGTEADRAAMSIDWGNDALLDATWHYEWTNEAWAPIPECDHVYDSVCDEDCNLCGRRRAAPHMYENACDDYCEACDTWREVAGHVYDNNCDVDCNECGAMRKPYNHQYDNDCDADCNECGARREVEGHVYDNACDTDCNKCGFPREVPGHVYDNACDADCNVCGATREVPGHVYDNACDADCNACGAVRTVGDHVYYDKYDADCNECGATRAVPDPVRLVVDDALAHPGYTFDVTIRVESNSGLSGLHFNVDFDDSRFELVSATAGEHFAAASFGPAQSPFNFLWMDSIHPEVTADGTIVVLTFAVKEGAALGTSTITVTPLAKGVLDGNLDIVPYETVSGTVNLAEILPGDADGDGSFDLKDLGVMMQNMNGWEVKVDEPALDVNRDGKMNNRDYALMQRYLNGWDVTLQ